MLKDKNLANKEEVVAILERNKKKEFLAVPATFMSKASRRMFEEEWVPGKNRPKPSKRKVLEFKQTWLADNNDDYLGPKIPSVLEFLENKIRMRELYGVFKTKSSSVQRSGEVRLAPVPVPHRKPRGVIQEEPLASIMRRKDAYHKHIIFESEQQAYNPYTKKEPNDLKKKLPGLAQSPIKNTAIIDEFHRSHLSKLQNTSHLISPNIKNKIVERLIYRP